MVLVVLGLLGGLLDSEESLSEEREASASSLVRESAMTETARCGKTK